MTADSQGSIEEAMPKAQLSCPAVGLDSSVESSPQPDGLTKVDSVSDVHAFLSEREASCLFAQSKQVLGVACLLLWSDLGPDC